MQSMVDGCSKLGEPRLCELIGSPLLNGDSVRRSHNGERRRIHRAYDTSKSMENGCLHMTNQRSIKVSKYDYNIKS